MNIEQLIFTWKGRHLVLTLFASIMINMDDIRQERPDEGPILKLNKKFK